MTRLLADLCCVLLVVVGHLIALPLFAWRGIQALRGGDLDRVVRAALLWDLCIGALLGAEPGETVSTMAQRVKGRWCLLCRLLSVRWPRHCSDADGVLFELTRRDKQPPTS